MDALLLPRNEMRLRADPPRMMPLAKLPVFFALEGRRVVVAGGSDACCLEGGTVGRLRCRGACLCTA